MYTKPKSLTVTLTVVNAALYAIGAYVTSYIESPWGIGQFRPAIVIPALFAILFGPWVGGVGAALGTLMASQLRYGQPILSLMSGTPANFLGFFILGKLLENKFNWKRFISASIVVLSVANLLCATGVLLYFTTFSPQFVFGQSPTFIVGFILGLTAWWYVTMLPFQLFATPVLIKTCCGVFSSIVPDSVKQSSLREEMPRKFFGLSLLLPGIAMLTIGAAATYTGLGYALVTGFKVIDRPVVLSGIRAMFLGSGGILSSLGMVLLLFGRK